MDERPLTCDRRSTDFRFAAGECGARRTISVDSTELRGTPVVQQGIDPSGKRSVVRPRRKGRRRSILAKPRSDRWRQPVAQGTGGRARRFVRQLPSLVAIAEKSRSNRRRKFASRGGLSERTQLGQHRWGKSRSRTGRRGRSSS